MFKIPCHVCKTQKYNVPVKGVEGKVFCSEKHREEEMKKQALK